MKTKIFWKSMRYVHCSIQIFWLNYVNVRVGKQWSSPPLLEWFIIMDRIEAYEISKWRITREEKLKRPVKSKLSRGKRWESLYRFTRGVEELAEFQDRVRHQVVRWKRRNIASISDNGKSNDFLTVLYHLVAFKHFW